MIANVFCRKMTYDTSDNSKLVFGQLPRLAAIDIGTNSIRSIVAELDPQEHFRILDDEKAMVRLGEGLNATGRISENAIKRACEALQRMKMIADGLGVHQLEAVATSAVRRAENGKRFLEDVRRETGVEIRVISGEEEANLAVLSARHNFDLDEGRFMMVDIGGGSVELVEMTGGHVESVYSLELGVVYLTEHFLRSDPVGEDEFRAMRKHIRKTLKKNGIGKGLPINSLIGSGGTMTNIAGMVMASRGEEFESVHRYEVLRSEIVHLLAMLSRLELKKRCMVPGLNPDRADIIVAGLTLVEELMKRCRSNLLRINHKGIREGLILAGLRRLGALQKADVRRDWRESVEDFARACHCDEQHSRQVSHLAMCIFDAVAESSNLSARDGELLEAASLLHDIGYFISYEKHHKHSYHLIRHANLFGFTPQERELIANIARYHRKAKPREEHDNFVRLDDADRQRVMRLGGILRLADGLDRRRNAQINDMQVELKENQLCLSLRGHSDLSVEIYGAHAKGDLYQKAFGHRLLVRAE